MSIIGNRKINMTGKRYGEVVAISDVGLCNDGKYKWLFLCGCGNEFAASGAKVRSGEVKTCPACSKERVRLSRMTHGMGKSIEYRAWGHIKSRCFNPKVPEFKHYGGRGITICDRWSSSFENFLADMGLRPSDKQSIDRIDNNGNYEPGNCRWASHVEQANNTRSNRKVTVNDITKTMSQWAAEKGMRREKVWKRLNRGKHGEAVVSPSIPVSTFEFQGITRTIREWSEAIGIKKATLYWRINTKNWPLEKALTKGARN